MLALGTGLGQGLVVLATPFLARIYGPAEFGALAILATIGNVALAAGCLRYDLALPSAPDADVKGIFVTALTVAVALGLLAAVAAVLLARSPWAGSVGAGLTGRPLLIGGCVTLAGIYQASSAWMLRRSAYRGLATMRILQGGGFGVLAAIQPIGLVWGHVLSFGSGLAASLLIVRREGPGGLTWWEAARRYREFPLFSLPGALLDIVGYSASIWVVSSTYGVSSAGEYSQIQRLIGAPLMLLSISLGQVLLRHTATLVEDPREMRGVILRMLRTMAALAAVALVALWLVGAPIISLILGPGWRVEREMVVLLGVTVFVRACVSPLSAALVTLRRFGVSLSWQGAYFVSAVLLFPWVAARSSLPGYVAFYAVHEVLFYGAYLYLILRAVKPRPCAGSSES
jgi:O-antigen/teichoic acid export membrane protein